MNDPNDTYMDVLDGRAGLHRCYLVHTVNCTGFPSTCMNCKSRTCMDAHHCKCELRQPDASIMCIGEMLSDGVMPCAARVHVHEVLLKLGLASYIGWLATSWYVCVYNEHIMHCGMLVVGQEVA